MKTDFLLAGLNLSTNVLEKNARRMHVLWMTLLKTREIKDLNV